MKLSSADKAEILIQILFPFFFVGYIYGGMYAFYYLTDFIISIGRVLFNY